MKKLIGLFAVLASTTWAGTAGAQILDEINSLYPGESYRVLAVSSGKLFVDETMNYINPLAADGSAPGAKKGSQNSKKGLEWKPLGSHSNGKSNGKQAGRSSSAGPALGVQTSQLASSYDEVWGAGLVTPVAFDVNGNPAKGYVSSAAGSGASAEPRWTLIDAPYARVLWLIEASK